MIVDFLFRNTIRTGDLSVIDSFGKVRRYGDATGPPVTIRVHDLATEWRIFWNAKLAVGEAFTDGRLTVEEGSLYDFVTLGLTNVNNLQHHPLLSFVESVAQFVRYLRTINPIGRARRNVAHHYDLSGELYDLFLDEDRQYSCAYFDHPEQNLEEAQFNKKRHIAAKLLLDRPDLKVLDIGSGWGGLALYLHEVAGTDVTGLTLSTEQYKVSNERSQRQGLDKRVRFKLEDYRQEENQYDRVVSVGMFEHVGPAHYRTFFAKVKKLLKPDGVALLHSIGHFEPPSTTNPWITKHIFPGGYLPSLSEVLAAIEKEGLIITDVEILRLHYAETLKNWHQRFTANREKAAAIYDERFCRMWDFYLTGCEAAFREDGLMVFQIQLARRLDSVPLQRDYITDWEREQRAATSQAAQ